MNNESKKTKKQQEVLKTLTNCFCTRTYIILKYWYFIAIGLKKVIGDQVSTRSIHPRNQETLLYSEINESELRRLILRLVKIWICRNHNMPSWKFGIDHFMKLTIYNTIEYLESLNSKIICTLVGLYLYQYRDLFISWFWCMTFWILSMNISPSNGLRRFSIVRPFLDEYKASFIFK